MSKRVPVYLSEEELECLKIGLESGLAMGLPENTTVLNLLERLEEELTTFKEE